MPSIAKRSKPSSLCAAAELGDGKMDLRSAASDRTPPKRKFRSDSSAKASPVSTPMTWTSPRRSTDAKLGGPESGTDGEICERVTKMMKSPVRNLMSSFAAKPNWNPRDSEQTKAVKEALHVSTAPSNIVCREDEQKRVFEFCKSSVEQEKSGGLYVCGCPGTGKSLSMEKVKSNLVNWAQEAGIQEPDVLTVNCTSLTNTSDIFSKMLGLDHCQKRSKGSCSPLKRLQKLYSQKPQSSNGKMMLLIADELDYLITKDLSVLHDLFMLTTLPFSRCILIGIANAIDLADRFLPRLLSLNCKPTVITFRAYSKDQILKILQERLTALPFVVFQAQALELCARKVAAASGDMRKALCVCRSVIEILEAEVVKETSEQQIDSEAEVVKNKREVDIVGIDDMVIALAKTYKSPVVETIRSLPQHQQIILCSAVKLFRGGKKDSTVEELNKSYMSVCKSVLIPPVGILELSSMCSVLNDQGLLKLGQSRQEKLKRVTLRADEADITFALQGIRFFRNCLQ